MTGEIDFSSCPRIAALDVEALMGSVPYLTDLQRRFYRAYLSARREKMFGSEVA